MPSQATYDDANLILRLYEMRREEKMRQAREWFNAHCAPTSMEDIARIAPPGSPESAYMRMVSSYWEMAASFVTSGILNQELFFQSGGELLFVWERMRPIVPAFRDYLKNPQAWHNIETVANAYIKYMEAKSPGAYSAFQQMVRQAVAAPATGKAGA
jgi:hypothetical protein